MIEIYPSTLPGAPIETHAAEGVTLEQWLIENVPSYRPGPQQPISATVNGSVVPPEQWAETWVHSKDRVELRVQPGDPGTIIYAVVAAVVAVAASVLLKPSIPSTNSKSTRGSSIYEANAEGNKPKLGDVIPEIAGRHKTFPDYLTAPRRYFIDTKTQALDLLLCIGKGEYLLPDAEIKIGSTPLQSLGTDVDYRVFAPGVDVTGHQAHRNWYNAPEVGASVGASGLRLKDGRDLTLSLNAAAISFSGSEITIPSGAGTPPADWEVGMLLEVDLLQEITATDGGQDINGVYLRDVLEGEFPTFAQGDAISISGGSAIGGNYLVHSYADDVEVTDPETEETYTTDQITLNSTDSVPTAFLPDGLFMAAIDYTGVRYRIDAFVTDAQGARVGISVTRLSPDGTEDSGWPGFDTQTTSDAAIRLDTTSLEGGWTGPYLACPEGEGTRLIEWDVFGPSGLGYIDDDGDIETRTRKVELQYRAYGATEWTSDVRTLTGATRDQLGWTFRTELPTDMTPQVRMRRIGAESNSTQALDRLEWYGLRCELPHKTSYPGVTVLAVTLVGSDTIASQTENQINCVATRILPVRRDGAWQPAEATRDIAPWVAYIADSVGAEVDFDELDRLDAIWRGRGEHFDFVTDDDSTVKESLNRVLAAGMAEFTLDAGQVRPVREDPRTVFEHTYTPQNTTKPLQRTAQAPRPDEPDGVVVTFFNSDTWSEDTVTCTLPDDAGVKLEKLSLDGVTNRTQAWRIGMRERRKLKYQRWRYSTETELDALNSRYKSFVALQGDVPGYGQSGWIKSAIDEGEGVYLLELSEPLEWLDSADENNPDVFGWRRPDGTLAGPFTASHGDSEYQVRVSLGDELPDPGQRMEPPQFLFGPADRWVFPALITDISPNGFESVSIEAVNYDARVYLDDDNAPA